MPRFICFIFLTLIAPFSPAAPVRLLSETSDICEHLFTIKTVRLSDLVAYALVEPEWQYLNSPREFITDHELKTATLLAERLKRSVALLPRFNKWMGVPAVDGIMFDRNGRPRNNFSLKTFFPSQGAGDLNQKLTNTLRSANRSIERNYSAARWRAISITDPACFTEARLYAKIFGLNGNQPRPVSVVIDYTADPTADFRLRMNLHPVAGPQAFLTLNERGQGISIDEMMDFLRFHPSIKEYIFLGIHHVLIVTADRYEMTEFCDKFGHSY